MLKQTYKFDNKIWKFAIRMLLLPDGFIFRPPADLVRKNRLVVSEVNNVWSKQDMPAYLIEIFMILWRFPSL